MDTIAKPEKETQRRLIHEVLGPQPKGLGYEYLGDWTDRDGNSNIETMQLAAWLKGQGNTDAQVAAIVHRLRTEAENPTRGLYGNNKAVHSLLRYGVHVKTEAEKATETVKLIDWDHPENNDFHVAEEVTLHGGHERRPDIVLYVNGIALVVIELKNSRKSIGEGIRQLISNQRPEFNESFFSTVQLLIAGNDSEGLKYGTIGTPEKYYLTWREDEEDGTGYRLDKYIRKLCSKERLLELVHDFILFDGGTKKVPRVHQYFAVKHAQEHVRQQKGGIIWHTQGSGKSIVMVLLARWILENNSNARVAIITDRDELDKQIERVFTEAGENIKRTASGRDLLSKLGQATPRLLCSLIHKFGRKDVDDISEFIRELEGKPSNTVGEVFVFVDEAHRTQSGKLHRIMKAMMPNAVFVGFTGTPLLKQDRQTTIEVFGSYIHTYKFNEAVRDGVILDLVYEARDIDQKLTSPQKVDEWFAAKTKGLNSWQQEELKRHWGTLQKVLSSKSRMDRLVSDIIFDFSVKPRLSSERGNAILVASSIYEACRYFGLFNETMLKGKCAVVTSYNPQSRDLSAEDTGANTETDKQYIYETYQKLLESVQAQPGKSKTETYEDRAKKLFIQEPSNMKLLIVVEKLLTGFDAPSCTYLYIDKSMQDHGLFQAICRTNRLDGEDKPYGYIVDYKDLFRKVENALAVYTTELDRGPGEEDPQILLKDRLTKGREQLEAAREKLARLCEDVEQPRGDLEYQRYFCGNPENRNDLAERDLHREVLYVTTAMLARAYANIADDLPHAGYSDAEIGSLQRELRDYVALRDMIRLASGETLDLKPYEADMRHLIDTYIQAENPRPISDFEDTSLLELIVESGVADAIAKKMAARKNNQKAVAETIENNIRRKIMKEHLNDPAFYEKMSALLDEIIKFRKEKADRYAQYLERVAELARQLLSGRSKETPVLLDTPGKRVLYHNLDNNEDLAIELDQTILQVRPDGWRGVQSREQVIKAALYGVLQDESAVERVFQIVVNQKEY
ncbi:MAG: restriction endonuclease subunit R [Spirochaetaceae bacterium]|nr:restriction endonuclease subunit R [Spirochaetaceae bacterium]|tara:strand:+ start:1855 stop:4917 length:3063 start_codon:yes stop_codon:yes gene_type:complete